MKIAIVGLLIGTIGAIPLAFAADWKVVGGVTDYYLEYIDMVSIKTNQNIRKAWSLRSYKDVQPANAAVKGSPYRSTKTFSEYDCKNEKIKDTYLVGYSDEMGKGSIAMSDENSSANWRPVVPDSVAEVTLKAVCNS